MIHKPRIGYASLNQKAHVHAPSRFLPIIIIPGIAGSRLTDPVTGKLAWNPLGSPLGKSSGVFTADYDRLGQIGAELVPDDDHCFDPDSDDGKAAARIKHYYTCLHDLYGVLAQKLINLDLSNGGSNAIKPKLYLCGYDWRQDNARSALRLSKVVDEALTETGERRVIIIAHSMGCVVSRYYCRALGGESKVHRLYLMGSPTLGAPGAYLNLKNGLPGLYAKDMIQNVRSGHGAAAVGEGIHVGAMVESAAGSWANDPSQKMMAIAVPFIGDLFVALSLGAGRLLSADELRAFGRLVPGLYQLLPSAIYCREYKNWLLFDPGSTGLPPTGYMIVLPTLFSIIEDLAGGAFKSFFQPDEAERTAPEATRNMQTLAQRLEAIGSAFADKTDYTPAGQQTETGASKFFDDEKHAIVMTIELVKRILMAFVDCSSNRQVYSDIYTGLLDIPELRPVCAKNLAMAFRLDDALTVDPNPEKGESPLELLATSVLLPALAMLPGGLGKWVSEKTASDPRFKKKKATAYMHPRATNVYGSEVATDAGGLLIPTDTVSNDDSNLVEWTLIPYSIVMPLLLLIGGAAGFTSDLSKQALGDGTVPLGSQRPAPDQISNPFFSEHKVGAKVIHMEIIRDPDVYDWLSKDLVALVPDFLQT